MKADPEVLRGLTSEIEAIIRRHVWARYVAAFDQPPVLGIGAAAAEIAALRAPQNDGAAAMLSRDAVADRMQRAFPDLARLDAECAAEAAFPECLAQPDPSQEPETGGERP